MFLLDPDVVSELRKAGDGKADANVVARLSRVDAATFYLSAIMEHELGILTDRAARPHPGGQATRLGG
jgi:toxin FitB